MKHWARNIYIIGVIRACIFSIFIIPVIALFWKKHGLTISDIFNLQAIFALSVIFFEIPTGYIGDKLGRKKTLILALGIILISWLLYGFATTFIQFVVIEISLGIGISFISGTDSALLYESLTQLNRTADYTRLEGKQRAIGMLCDCASALIGGFFISFTSYRLLFMGSVITSAIALVHCFFIVNPQSRHYNHPRGTLYGFYKIGRFVFLKSKIVRYVIPLMASLGLCTMLGIWLYQPLWAHLKIPVYLFGVLWALRALPTLGASYFAHSLEKKLGHRNIILLMSLPAFIGYFILAFAPGYYRLIGILFVQSLFGLTNPILAKYIQHETFDDKRATVMSIQSWLFRLGYFITAPIVGQVAKKYSFTPAFFTDYYYFSSFDYPFYLCFFKKWRCILNR
ncbi:MAG: MFS transporter [Spirochaetes bacterium]|nr:MFS transporter [Spirochaetota bacterium]